MRKYNDVVMLRVEQGIANVVYDNDDYETPIDLPDGEYVLEIEFYADYLPRREAPPARDDISLATPPEDAEIQDYEITDYALYNEDGEKTYLHRSEVDTIVNNLESQIKENMIQCFENE